MNHQDFRKEETVNTFDDEHDLLQFITGAVPSLSAALQESPDLAGAIAGPFAVENPDARRPPAGTRGLVVRRLHWVIQDDDLAALKAIGDGVKAAAGAGFFVNLAAAAAAPLAGAMVGVVFATLTLLRQAWKKGASLTTGEMAVLAILASARRAIPAAQITEALAQQHPGAGWDAARVTKVLASLAKVRLSDGAIKAFVAQDAEENWSAVDTGLVF